MTNTVYYAGEKTRIGTILEGASVAMVCNPEDEAHIFGFLVWDYIDHLFVLHYVHMKRTYQRMGIASAAIRTVYPKVGRETFIATHLNKLTAEMRGRYQFRYSPYILDLVFKDRALKRREEHVRA